MNQTAKGLKNYKPLIFVKLTQAKNLYNNNVISVHFNMNFKPNERGLLAHEWVWILYDSLKTIHEDKWFLLYFIFVFTFTFYASNSDIEKILLCKIEIWIRKFWTDYFCTILCYYQGNDLTLKIDSILVKWRFKRNSFIPPSLWTSS